MGCTSSKYSTDSSITPRQTGYDIQTLGTGDLVFFSQTNTVAQSLITVATRSKWTHVGLVIDLPTLYPTQSPLMLESCNNYEDDLVDLLSGETLKSGVRLVSLRDRLQLVRDREIAVRELEIDTNFNTDHIDAVNIFGVVASFCRKPYEKSKLQLIMSASPFNQRRDESSLFCSELVAAALQRLNLLNSRKSSNSYTPKSFTKKSFGMLCGQHHTLVYVQVY